MYRRFYRILTLGIFAIVVMGCIDLAWSYKYIYLFACLLLYNFLTRCVLNWTWCVLTTNWNEFRVKQLIYNEKNWLIAEATTTTTTHSEQTFIHFFLLLFLLLYRHTTWILYAIAIIFCKWRWWCVVLCCLELKIYI